MGSLNIKTVAQQNTLTPKPKTQAEWEKYYIDSEITKGNLKKDVEILKKQSEQNLQSIKNLENKNKKDDLIQPLITNKEENNSKVSFGVSFSLFYENPSHYILLGNSNPLLVKDSIWYRHLGGMVSGVLNYKLSDHLGLALNIPVGTIASTINLGNKTSPFGLGLSWQFDGIKIVAIANISQSLKLRKEDLNKQLFPLTNYPNLKIGARIPDEVLKNFAINGFSVFPSVGVIFPLTEFKKLK